MSEESTPPGRPGDDAGERRRSLDAEHKARTMAKVQPIIEAAEQAATGILEEAEAQARRQVERAQARADELATQRAEDMWILTDELISRAEGVKRQADELLDALETTRRGVGSAIDAARETTTPAPVEPDPPRPPEPTSSPAGSAGESEPGLEEVQVDRVEIEMTESRASRSEQRRPSPPLSEGARLLATQMVIAGSSRAEIAHRLRQDFGIEDPEAMLDAIHGIE